MQVRLERDLSHFYLVPDVRGQYTKEDYQIHMLMENQISGLLSMHGHYMDGMQEYYYDITSMKSMEQIYDSEFMNEGVILSILKALYGVVHELEKYLLDENCILLDTNCIYMDEESRTPYFCYLPGNKKTIEASFCELSEYILHHLDQKDQKAVLLGYEIYRQASQNNYSLESVLKKAFETKTETTEKEVMPEKKIVQEKENIPSVNYKEESDKRKSVEVKEQKKRKSIKPEKEKKQKHVKEKLPKRMILLSCLSVLIFTGIIVLIRIGILTATQGGGIAFLGVGIFGFALSEQKKEADAGKKETIKSTIKPTKDEKESNVTKVLWEGEEEYQPRLSLIGMNSRDRMTIILQNDSYLVGKHKSKVDICVNDPAVSRIHARITKDGDDYYISDLNSTNGTFYNGRRLESGEKVKLELTDEITFAESGFYIGNC